MTNIGNVEEEVNLTGSSASGWSFVFTDANGVNIGTTATIKGDYGVSSWSPGTSKEIFIKVFVPVNATVGFTDVLTITATGTSTSVTDSAIDATTVIEGNLQLTKSGTPSSVAPTLTSASANTDFHPITYKTEYQNLGAASITTVEIIDAIPANTRFVAETGGLAALQLPSGTKPDATFSGGTALVNAEILVSTDGGATYVDMDNLPAIAGDHSIPSVTHVKFVIGSVASGEKGQVIFQVLVK